MPSAEFLGDVVARNVVEEVASLLEYEASAS